jgi:predicted 3-demethylubiquinone-9 3-methyltransferase (glyoxalase superfamily)
VTGKITPFLWFDTQAEEAARFYVSIFPNSRVLNVWRAGDQVQGVSFVLNGQEVRGLNGGPRFRFTEAFSMFVDCENQDEVDRYWAALTADGGAESMCGWLKDKYGLSWQIIPTALGRLLGDPDREKAGRAIAAMLKMRKIVIRDLEAAFEGQG